MYTAALYPIILWLNSLGSQTGFIWLQLIAVIMTCISLAVDGVTAVNSATKVRLTVTHILIIIYALLALVLVVRGFVSVDLFEYSSPTSIMFYGVVPVLLIIMHVYQKRSLLVVDVPAIFLSTASVVLAATFLSRLAIFSGFTESTYGSVVASGQLLGTTQRIQLPGFPGIVSGGILAGISVICGLLLTFFPKSKKQVMVGLGIMACSLPACIMTEVRSNFVVLFIVCSYILYVKTFSKALSVGAYVLITTAFIAPFIYNAVAIKTEAGLKLSGVGLVRTMGEEILALSGRRETWNITLDSINEEGVSLWGRGLGAEVVRGISEAVVAKGIFRPGAESAVHSHNALMNALLNGGILWCLSYIIVIYAVAYRLRRSVILYEGAKYCKTASFLVIAISVYGIFESIISVRYIYFHGLLIIYSLLALDSLAPLRLFKNVKAARTVRNLNHKHSV